MRCNNYSIPRSKEIMRNFKDMEWVEQLGSGIPRVLQTYGRECFKFSDNYIRMSFPREQIIEEQTEGKTTNDKIVELLQNNPMMTREVLAEILQLSVRGVEYQLKKLKETGVIKRQGERKEGYWLVNLEKKKIHRLNNNNEKQNS